MTKEEKQLLLKDLCARLPYGVLIEVDYLCNDEWQSKYPTNKDVDTLKTIDLNEELVVTNGYSSYDIEEIKPYLRPMSSMTEEELNELLEFEDIDYNNNSNVVKRAMMAFSEDKKIESNSLFCIQYARSIDWLNAHHFDYNGLIEKGLAIEAPKGMYKN